MSQSPNPAPVKRWLASVYPTLQLDPEWLAECLAYLSTHRQDLLGAAALLKTVEQQILLSPLEACTSQGSLPVDLEGQDGILSPGKAVLVQVVSMDEVGQSAVSLRDALQARREDARLGLQADRVRVQGLTQDGAEAEDGSAAAGGSSGNGPTAGAASYPRAMLKLELSDGHSVCTAIEYRRVPALDLASTELGAKLLLKNAQLRRGTILLEPHTVTVKGESEKQMRDFATDTDATGTMLVWYRWFYTRTQGGPRRPLGGPAASPIGPSRAALASKPALQPSALCATFFFLEPPFWKLRQSLTRVSREASQVSRSSTLRFRSFTSSSLRFASDPSAIIVILFSRRRRSSSSINICFACWRMRSASGGDSSRRR